MKKKINSLYYIYDIENLWDIICRLDNGNANVFKENVKKNVLKIIKKMLNQNVIFIGNQWVNKNSLKKWELSNDEIIEKLKKEWTKDIDFSTLYNLAWIGYEDWYIGSLKKIGLKPRLNWENFIKEEIGDLEKWIEDNKPKNIYR